MNESSQQTLVTLSDYRAVRIARYGKFLAVGIPAIGIPAILLTRLLSWLYQPQLFNGTLPSISKTAAYSPGSWLFTPAMTLVAAAIVIAWPISYMLNRREILKLVPPGTDTMRLGILNAITMLLGMTAGLALGGLSIIHLEVNSPTHMLLSKIFFSTMILALFSDCLLAQRLGKYASTAAARSPNTPGGMGLRYPICLLVFIWGLFFLFMFLIKDTELIPHPMLVRWLYVGSESILCILLLLYSLSYLPLLRHVISEDSSVNDEPFNISMREQSAGN